MSKTNCVNCGAAKDIDEIKCPYCGTTYLDFTAIDFDSNEPVVCQFILPGKYKLGETKNKIMLSMLALPRLEEISTSVETVTCYGGMGSPVCTFDKSYGANIGVSFIPICKPGSNTLFTLKAHDNDL